MVALNDQISSTNTKPSWLILKEAFENLGVKEVTRQLGLRSPAIVYKWAEKPATIENPDASGQRSPLDMVREFIRVTGDSRILEWLCREFNGQFVPNVFGNQPSRLFCALSQTNEVAMESAEFIQVSLSAIADGGICENEKTAIREKAEDLKVDIETLIVGVESGAYAAAVAM